MRMRDTTEICRRAQNMHIAWATTLPYLLLCMVCAVSLSFLYISVKRHRMRLNNRSIGTLAPDGGRLDCSGGARAEHRTVCARADRKDALTRGHNALYASATCAHSHARSACALPTHVVEHGIPSGPCRPSLLVGPRRLSTYLPARRALTEAAPRARARVAA